MRILTCAIQFGSSRIMAIAAWKNMQTGALENIEIESEPTGNCISHGRIVNNEKAAMHIKSVIQKLGNRMRSTISSAYVGMGGMSLHSLIQQPSVQIPGYDVLHAEPISGGQHQLIVGDKGLRQGVTAAMERAGIRIHDIIVLPQATACILKEEERQQGCALIDLGAGTTTVSVYKNGELQHLAVIPLGGDSVTKDIESAGCTREEAERIKLEWSDAAHEGKEAAGSNQQSAANVLFADKALPIPQGTLNTIVTCRYEEIAANILHQIEVTGLKDHLDAGCILTGGVAVQRGLTTLLAQRLGIPHIETRAYYERAFIGSERKPHLTNLLALLNFCAEDCQAPAKATVASTVVKPAAASPVSAKPAAAPVNTHAETGQLSIEMPEPEPDPEPVKEEKEEKPKTSSFKAGVSRFFSDLLSGQN